MSAKAGFTIVSATYLQDATGTVIDNATIRFEPVDNNGNPLSFMAGGLGGQVSTEPVSAQVTEGVFSIQLADTTLTNPVHVGYAVTVEDNNTGRSLLGPGYSCIQPYGALWSFDTYVPNVAAQLATTYGPNTFSIYTDDVTGWLYELRVSGGAFGPVFAGDGVAPGYLVLGDGAGGRFRVTIPDGALQSIVIGGMVPVTPFTKLVDTATGLYYQLITQNGGVGTLPVANDGTGQARIVLAV